MAAGPSDFVSRSRGPLIGRFWVLACVVAASFGSDRVERAAHRPLCVEACARVGQLVDSVANGSGSGRGNFLDTTIRCRCSAGQTIRLSMSVSECLDWLVATLLLFAILLATVALTRWLWRNKM